MSQSEEARSAHASLRFDERGLIPVVTQDAADGEVLMLAYANAEAIAATLSSGDAHYYSRSRASLWRKGATSGNVQRVVEVRYDCDGDAVLYLVQQTGPACHTGERSCFHNDLALAAQAAARNGGAAPPAGAATEATAQSAAPAAAPTIGDAIDLLERVVADRLANPREGSYVWRMHQRGVGYVSQKVIEEAGETVVAALERKDAELVEESADLLFHLGVLLAERGVPWSRVAATLVGRHTEAHEDTHEPQA